MEQESEKLLKEIGNRIRVLRQEREISQQNLAAMCNFEKSNMSRIEAGGSNVTIKTLLTISQALEIHISELFPKV